MLKKNNKTLVIKVGGALLQCEMGMERLMGTAAKMIAKGQKLILVHGGGYLVDKQLAVNGMQTKKLNEEQFCSRILLNWLTDNSGL